MNLASDYLNNIIVLITYLVFIFYYFKKFFANLFLNFSKFKYYNIKILNILYNIYYNFFNVDLLLIKK